jgi:hypothetical protein
MKLTTIGTARGVAASLILPAALACSDGAGPSSSLPLKAVDQLAAQLDTIDAGFTSPQLKSLSALALPMLAAGLDVQHMDSTVLGKTVEWDPIGRRVILTTRPGTPGNLLQVRLYELDVTGLPALPKVEIGYAYLEPLNKFNGGRPDSTFLRFTVFNLPGPGVEAVADWMVWRLPADTACGQCATIYAGTSPVAPGGRFIYLTVPYSIPPGGDGTFSGSSDGAGFSFVHSATLPGPSSTAATANWAFSWQGDSIRTTSGPLHPGGGQLVGGTDVTINGVLVATVTRAALGTTVLDPHGRRFPNLTDGHVLGRLFDVPADIADYIEWPTFVLFFCGC